MRYFKVWFFFLGFFSSGFFAEMKFANNYSNMQRKRKNNFCRHHVQCATHEISKGKSSAMTSIIRTFPLASKKWQVRKFPYRRGGLFAFLNNKGGLYSTWCLFSHHLLWASLHDKYLCTKVPCAPPALVLRLRLQHPQTMEHWKADSGTPPLISSSNNLCTFVSKNNVPRLFSGGLPPPPNEKDPRGRGGGIVKRCSGEERTGQ